jgi:hypothetical protein
MELVIGILAFIAFDVLAVIFGYDSRDKEALGGYLRPFRREDLRRQ